MIRRCFLCAVFLACLAIGALLEAQDRLTRIYGTEDQQVAVPTITAVSGQKDAAAVQQLISFLTATELAGFRDMKGTGTAILPGETGPLPSTMYLQGTDRFRLDVQTANGPRTLLVDGLMATVVHETKPHYCLPPTAAALPIVALATSALTNLSQPGFSLIDDGMLTVNGTPLHRVTLQMPFSIKGASQLQKYVAMDLYFDPTSHLLVKSAAAIRLNDDSNEDYLRVTTYEDYRQVNGILFPFGYHETLNGQREWTLHLSDVQLNAGVESSTFQVQR